jgi:hypothetical protein
MTVTRVAPISLAKILGCLYAALGLIFGVFFALLSSVAGFAAPNQGMPAFMGMMFGVGAIVLMPIFYGVMGFLSGAIGAVIYNVLAKWLGGVELNVQDSRATLA